MEFLELFRFLEQLPKGLPHLAEPSWRSSMLDKLVPLKIGALRPSFVMRNDWLFGDDMIK